MSKLNWENLSDTDCKKYTEITRTLLENIVVNDNIKCESISCNDTCHVEAVSKLYDDIINCLKEASDKAFPSTSNRGYTTMPGWSEYVADLYKTSRDVREMWLGAGRPRNGLIFDLHMRTKARCKYAIRFIKRNEKQMRKESLAKKLSTLDNNSFWKEVRHMNHCNTPLPTTIDGVTGEANIAGVWRKHFEDLLNCQRSTNSVVEVPNDNLVFDDLLVSKEEIVLAIKGLENNKSCGLDGINNYRGITLLSCLGKLFTSILNNRLYAFCEENKILGESQAGFRKGYSTLDHIFVLKNAIDLFLTEKKKLFCCFVDYTKAFDMVWREALWYKLLKYGVSGKVLNVIKGMYARVRSCVLLNGERSDYFIASKGVRQGENLSPLLFALFVNDLEEHLLSKECTYAQLPADTRDNYLKLLVLMYADDTILIADSAKKLKQAIHSMESYCDKWQLNVNKAKTKIMIFSKVKAKTHKYKFTHEDTELEIVDNYKYLGLTLAHNGSFKLAITSLCTQASRAMYSLIGKSRRLDLPIDLQLELFDNLVLPIMLYGCEIWGCGRYDDLEILHRKYLKHILGVSGKTVNNMVYGELGRYPLEIQIKERVVGYWGRLIMGKEGKTSRKMYDYLLTLYHEGLYTSPWLKLVKGIFLECNMTHIWDKQGTCNICPKTIKGDIANKLKELYVVKWKEELTQMSSCDVYTELKHEFKLEKYLLNLDIGLRRIVSGFRTNNNRLPKITGRYMKPKVERHQRVCTLCNDGKVGDEYHLIFECTHRTVSIFRKKYVPKFYSERPSMMQCINLIRSENVLDNRKLGLFLKNTLPLYK